MKTSRIAALAFVLALAGCPKTPDPEPIPPPAVVNSFTVTPKLVTMSGAMVTLTWDTADATRITLEQVGKGPLPISATEATGSTMVAITADTTFVLTARGLGGTDSSVQSVNLQGSTGGFLFDASPKRLEPGEMTTLVWNVPGATSVTIRPAGGMPLDLKGQTASGSVLVSPAVDTKYELSTDMMLGSVDVVVVPRITSFTASPSPGRGQPVTLSWAVAGGGTKLTLERDGAAMPLLTEMNAANIARGQFSETPPSLPAEGLYTYTLKLEHGGTTQTASVTVRVAGSLLITSFTAPSWVRPGFPYTVGWRTVGASHLEVRVDDVPVYVAPSEAAANAGATTLLGLQSGESKRVKLIVRNNRGGELVREKTVAAVEAPVFVSFTSDVNTANGGDPVVLSWSVTNARDVRINQEGVGTVHVASGNVDTGSVTVYPNKQNAKYTLLASNGAGQSVPPASLTITVGTVARLTFAGPAAPGTNASVTGHTVPGGTEVFGLPVVVKNQAGEAFVDIAGSTELNTADADATGNLNPIGETFSTRIFGRRVSFQNSYISPNGWFLLNDGFFAGPNVNQPIGTSLLASTMAPYFRDLRLVAGVSRIWGRVDSVGNDRRFIVQWTDMEDKAAVGSRLTFQAQVYTSGKVVFAYAKLDGIAAANGDIGVVNGTNTKVLQPVGAPVVGDTFTFFGPATLPLTLQAENAIYVARVSKGAGFVEVEGDTRYWLQITEANPRPAASVTNGEWLEIQNTTSSPLDLNGYTLNFGGTNNHVIANSVVVPANGRIVLAQALNLGDAAAGVSAAYVYPASLTMPDTSGAVSLVIGGSNYSQLAWTSTSAPAAGASVLADTQTADGVYAGSVVCPATVTMYGTQLGSPGAAAQAKCFPYTLTRIPGAFESIAMTMDAGVVTTGANDSTTAVAAPVMYYGASVPTLYVSTNGWISTSSTTSAVAASKTVPSTSVPVGSIAPFWIDLAFATGAGNGIYRTVKDPDGVPANGDEYTIVSWENFHIYVSTGEFDSHRLDFQVKFFANGNIEYHYGTLSSPGRDFEKGSFGTMWLEDRTGRGALVGSLYSTIPGVSSGTAFRFAYTP